MTHLNLTDSAEPRSITHLPPSNDLPTLSHRTMSLPQILAGLTDDELASWPGDLAHADGRSGARLEVERHPKVAGSTSLGVTWYFSWNNEY